MLADQHALPNDIDPVVTTAKISDGGFEASDRTPMDAEDVEKLIPERLRLGPLALSVPPFMCELNRPISDFLKRQSHSLITVVLEANWCTLGVGLFGTGRTVWLALSRPPIATADHLCAR